MRGTLLCALLLRRLWRDVLLMKLLCATPPQIASLTETAEKLLARLQAVPGAARGEEGVAKAEPASGSSLVLPAEVPAPRLGWW